MRFLAAMVVFALALVSCVAGCSEDKQPTVGCMMHQAAGSEHHRARCEFFTRVAEATAPSFREIKAAGRLPAELYVFSLFRAVEGGHSQSLVGFFTSRQSCEQLEALARQRALATTACKRWKA